MDFDNQSDDLPGLPGKSREELHEEIARDLRTNEKYSSFFERFNTSTVDPFIEYYAGFKADLILHGKRYIQQEERDAIARGQRGVHFLWQIQQRKLLDLQSRWRADLITLPDVHTTFDFTYWSALIQRCPFIPPITEEEFSAFHDYVLSDYFDIDELHQIPWQEYRWLRNWNEDESEIAVPPGWYRYCEDRLGWNEWRELPDVRGEKEEKYFSLTRGLRIAAQASQPIDKRPQLHTYDHEQMEAFAMEFESPELLRYLQAMKRVKDADQKDPELDWAMEMLRTAEDPLPMERNDNWREGIIQAALSAERAYVEKACVWAFGEYLRREEVGLGHEVILSDRKIERVEKQRALFVEELLHGKILNNESPELDY